MNTFFSATAERNRSYRIVGVAAVLVAAVAVGVMFAVNANRPQPTSALPAGANVQASPAPSPVSSPSAAPVVASTQAVFSCSSSNISATQSPAAAFVDAIRVGSHAGYDRVVVEFKNGQPGSISIRPQAGTTFHQAPSGKADTLAGRNGILVIIRGADAHTAYSGVRDLKTSSPSLAEVRVIEDFEGQISLGLGLKQTSCYRASVLTNPVRLVIDVQAS